ncbi:MAG TPA: hypothetical protein VMJ64_04750 [Anaerolineales bacterium]|nr:hypothetical protein [Anaerolineales bacterium]
MADATPISESFQYEYGQQEALFRAQPAINQRFLEAQARRLGDALVQRVTHVSFSLPDRVVCDVGEDEGSMSSVPASMREQSVGGWRQRLARQDVHLTLRQSLSQLEQSPERSVAVSAALVRHATAMHMVHNMLPAGRSVTYRPEEGEEVPSIPVADAIELQSAITATTDAIVEESDTETGRGNLLVPYVQEARLFYLPQWVAFGRDDKLLVGSINEAEADIASMQHFLEVIFAARSLAPYIIVDEEYQKKRYGMLGQLINQGRALARYKTHDIIGTIKDRVAAQSLNRGLSLHLPYFDDQDLKVQSHDFVVIPAGRIMFVPAFVVRAALEEEAKVGQDTRFSPSTRKHLMLELQMLADAFAPVDLQKAESR